MRGDAERRILIVEDEENLRITLQDNLEEEGYRVSAVGDGAGARDLWSKQPFDLCVLDVALPDTDGYTRAAKPRSRISRHSV